MLSWFLGLFFEKNLEKELDRTKRIKVKGFKFTIKRVSPLDHLKGSKVMLQAYEVLKMGKVSSPEASEKKIKEHLTEVLLAGVVHPKLSLKEDEGIQIDKLFVDYELVNDLYAQIIAFTYGKKKMQALPLAAQNKRKLIS